MKYFTLILILAASHCLGQKDTAKLPYKDGKVVYQEVDSINGATKGQLYNKAKLWVANTFKSANAVLQIDDKESGQLVGKGFVDTYYRLMGVDHPIPCYFTLKIDCRDGKIRATIYDIYFDSVNGYQNGSIEECDAKKGSGMKYRREIIGTSDSKIKATLSSLRTALQNNVADNF